MNIRPILLIFSQTKLDEVNAILRASPKRLLFELRWFAQDGLIESQAGFAGKTERSISR